MRGGAGGECGGDGKAGGSGGAPGVVGVEKSQASSGTVHTPQLRSHSSLSLMSLESQFRMPIVSMSAHVLVRWSSSSLFTQVFTTQGAAGLGGECRIGHSVLVPSAKTMCHGTECGSRSVSLCMYT